MRIYKSTVCIILALCLCACGVQPGANETTESTPASGPETVSGPALSDYTLPESSPAYGNGLTDAQNVIVQTALSYFYKGDAVQYGSFSMSDGKRNIAQIIQQTNNRSPEDSSIYNSHYTVCSAYPHDTYFNALGYHLLNPDDMPDILFRIQQSLSKNYTEYSPEELDELLGLVCTTVYLTEYAYGLRSEGKTELVPYFYSSLTTEGSSPAHEAEFTDGSTQDLTNDQIQEMIDNLQPGDIITAYDYKGGSGHAMMYLGEANYQGRKLQYVIHSSGYNFTFGSNDKAVINGEKIKGSAILKPDGTFSEIYNKDNSYYKIAKFLNNAYQRGLVDPESGEQDWNAVAAKLSARQVDLMWYSWQVGFTNSSDYAANGATFIYIPVADQQYYADADRYFGADRVWAVGSKVSDEKYQLILKFLDWYASPEGMTFQHVGIEGLNYTKNEDGTFTKLHDDALALNLEVPAEYGGGGYSDGNNAINQWIGASICVNPDNGERFPMKFWKSYKEWERENDKTKAEWQEKFGAENPVDYMLKNGMLTPSPSVGFAPPEDSLDIQSKREDVNKQLCTYTWKMIFAKDDAEFDALWDEMIEKMDGFGYKELYEYDCGVWQVEVDAKAAAAAAAK